MSKKKSKKDNVLIETVKMQGEQAMQLVKQAKFNQNLLDEVIGLKDAVDTLNKIGIQLGLTPKGRQELMEIAGEEKNKVSTAEMLKDFLGK